MFEKTDSEQLKSVKPKQQFLTSKGMTNADFLSYVRVDVIEISVPIKLIIT
jgi:hypothetical protein